MLKHDGYTLLEVTLSISLLTVVSLLGFVVLKTSTESAALASAKEEMQAGLRDAMAAISADVSVAYSERSTDAEPPLSPSGVESMNVSEDGRSIVFQVPEPSQDSRMVIGSAPITIILENEDRMEGTTGEGNARLDPGEDENGDGVLTRRLVRTDADGTTVLGAANCIADVQFQLQPAVAGGASTVLWVQLTGSKRYGQGEGRLIRAQLQSAITMTN